MKQPSPMFPTKNDSHTSKFLWAEGDVVWTKREDTEVVGEIQKDAITRLREAAKKADS